MTVRLPLPWNRQPAGSAGDGGLCRVNDRRPLFVVNAPTGPVDLVTGIGPVSGGVPMAPGPLGLAWVCGGESGYIYPTTLRLADAQEITVYALVESFSTGGNNGHVLLRSMGSAVPSFSVGIHHGSADGMYAAVNGTTADSTGAPVASIGDAATDALRLLVLTMNGNTGEWAAYGDSVLQGAGSGLGAIDYSRADLGVRFLTAANSAVSTFRGRVYTAGVIAGAMSAAEVERFRPWDMFAPRSIWAPVSAGGGGATYTLSAPTYVPGSLSATGLTARVTVTAA